MNSKSLTIRFFTLMLVMASSMCHGSSLKSGGKRKFTLQISEYDFPKFIRTNIKVRVVTNGLWSNIIEIKNPNKKILQTTKQP